jgi:hypothetical protein
MKIKIYHLAYLGLAVLPIFISGCEMPRSYGTSLFGIPIHACISPIYPAMGYGYVYRYLTIDTLTPELKWRDLKKRGQTYDVAIWETPYRSIEDVDKKADQLQSSWGELIFYTNNIPTNFYQITIPLKPDTYYNWSVRIRDGEKVKSWSSFNQAEDEVVTMVVRDNNPFGFKTPATPKK